MIHKTLATLLLSAVSSLSQAATSPMPLSKDIPSDYAQKITDLLIQEGEVLQQAVGSKMQVVVMSTDDPTTRNFIARGILHTDEDSFQHQENGLAALLVGGGKINGVTQTVCYVVFNKERAGHIWRNFIVPLSQGDNLNPGISFLMGHEVGHCLDHQERTARLSKTLTLAEAGTVGIQTDAWIRSGGATTITNAAYAETAKTLFKDGGQRQYQERVADAFGVLWGWHRGLDVKSVDVVRENRANLDSWSTHSTNAALNGIEEFYDVAPLSINELWMLARGIQVRTGVDKRLMAGGDKAIINTVAKTNNNTVALTETPQQPQPKQPLVKDAMGRVIFENTRKFGSGINGGN